MDVKRLISEVHLRPELYDAKCLGYSQRVRTDKAWVVIGKKLGQPAIECKKRWRNLRDSFLREVRDERCNRYGYELGKRKRAYLHYNKLAFLLPHIRTRSQPAASAYAGSDIGTPTMHLEITSNEVAAPELNLRYPESSSVSDQFQESDPLVINEPLDIKSEIQSPSTPEPSPGSIASNMSQPPTFKETPIHPTPSKMSICQHHEMDADEHYLLSLLPTLRDLPPETKSLVKMDIQRLLHQATYGASYPPT